MIENIKQDSSTYAVKLDGEVKQELQTLLEGYKQQDNGANAGDFIKTLLEVYKTNKITGNVTGADADIKELNSITNRIYAIYGNLVERTNTSNNALQLAFGDQLGQKETTVSNLKVRIAELNQEREVLEGVFNGACEDKKELENANIQLQKLNNSLEFNNSKLIEDTKGLQDLKHINSKLSVELEEYKKLLADAQARNIDKDNLIKDKDNNINVLSKDIEKMKQEAEKELAQLKKENELNIRLAVAEVKESLNNKLSQEQTKHNAEVEIYQSKYKTLLEDLEKARTIPKANKKDSAAAKK